MIHKAGLKMPIVVFDKFHSTFDRPNFGASPYCEYIENIRDGDNTRCLRNLLTFQVIGVTSA